MKLVGSVEEQLTYASAPGFNGRGNGEMKLNSFNGDATALLTVADICRKLGVSRAWVIEHSNGRRRPVLPSIKLGKVRRFDPNDVEGFIDDCRRIGQARVRSHTGKL
jgi:hypothetical protein